MKKTRFWSLVALCLCLAGAVTLTTACGDDDDKGGTTTIDSPIVGTWELVGEYDDGEYYTKNVRHYTFGADGKFSNGFTYYTARDFEHEKMLNSGTYSVDGSKVTLNYTKSQFWLDGQEQTEEYASRFEAYSEVVEFAIRDNQLFFIYPNPQGDPIEQGPFIKK